MQSRAYLLSNRLFEWVSGFALLAYGTHVLLAPNTLVQSRQAALLVLFSAYGYGALCLLIGGVRFVSLYKNGEWPYWGPRIRVGLALVAAVLYAQIAASLIQWVSPGTWPYFAFVLGELVTIWRVQREANACRAG